MIQWIVWGLGSFSGSTQMGNLNQLFVWPSSYVDPNLMPFGGYPDLGSFTGGIALATGSFDPGMVPDWEFGLPGSTDETDANLYSISGFPVVSADNVFLTVRNVVPEPSAIVLFGLALTCACTTRRR